MHTSILANLVITRVRAVTTVYTPENTKAKKNFRQCWAIIVKYEGETVYTSGGRRFVSDIGHIVVLPQGCAYEWVCTKAGHFSIVEFESEPTFREPLSFTVKNGERILKKVRDLEYKRSLKKTMMEMESIRDAYSILLLLSKAEGEPYLPNEKQEKIAPALEYIAHHYNERITNASLAAVAGMSTAYFRKLFVGVMGVSAIAYARDLRIEKAKEMLKSDYGSLSDVALSLGYHGLYDFSRDFKKHTGVSPSKYEGK